MGLREMAEQAAVDAAVQPSAETIGRAADLAAEVAAAPLADVNESEVPASLDVPVHVAWARMMQDVQWLGKDRQGRDYRYRGIDDVMNLVGPAERKHGVFVMPTGIEPTFEVINTKGGSPMNYCRAVVHFRIYGPRGDSMDATTLGEGFDTGDKSGSKAQSIALRTLYLNGLAIQTNEPARDTEYGQQHEIASAPVLTAADYMGDILDEKTTINRLSQIKAALDANRAMGMTEVELADGRRVALAQLVREVGRARTSGGAA